MVLSKKATCFALKKPGSQPGFFMLINETLENTWMVFAILLLH